MYETANLLVTRELFDRIEGFEDWLPARLGKPLAEDVWFGWRARRAGARTAFCSEAIVHHARMGTPCAARTLVLESIEVVATVLSAVRYRTPVA